MNAKIILSISLVLFCGSFVSGQNPTSTPVPQPTPDYNAQQRAAEQRRIEETQRRNSQEAFRRLQAISDGRSPESVIFVREQKGVSVKYSPRLNEQDIRAISISPADLKTYAAFLKASNTGITRLQNADVCPASDLVVQASNVCPNNVAGKATAFSFRAVDYRLPMFADVFFKGNKLSSTGALIIGIFSNLGKPDINLLNTASDGVKQLLEFQPPETESEIAKQYSILKRGIQVGNNIYKLETEIKEGDVYVLRSVAYKGKIFKGEGNDKINLLETDERKDVTVVFKILRQLDDGSIILLWKEISRTAPPKINLEMKSKDSKSPKKNEFTK